MPLYTPDPLPPTGPLVGERLPRKDELTPVTVPSETWRLHPENPNLEINGKGQFRTKDMTPCWRWMTDVEMQDRDTPKPKVMIGCDFGGNTDSVSIWKQGSMEGKFALAFTPNPDPDADKRFAALQEMINIYTQQMVEAASLSPTMELVPWKIWRKE